MTHDLTALQAAALLLLVRLSVFFCDDAPFTSAYACSTAAVTWLAAAAALLLLTIGFHFSRITRRILRICVLIASAWLLWRVYILLTFLHMPHITLTMGILLLTLLWARRLPHAAAARAAVILVILAAAGFLLLPVSGIGTAETLHLFLPGDFAASLLREVRISVDFLLLPLLLPRVQGTAAKRRAVLWWALGRGVVLPLAVAFGAMQNGRLTGWQGSPFFLLLARTPLSDAVRVDGFWIVLAVGVSFIAICSLIHNAESKSSAET